LDDPNLRVESIPLSVVHLILSWPTLEQVEGLLSTRHKRDLQSVHFVRVFDRRVAASAAELVSTDQRKQWSYRGAFIEDVGTAFCRALVSAQSATRCNSLTALNVSVYSSDLFEWPSLLHSFPELRSFQVDCIDVIHSLNVLLLTVHMCVFRSHLQGVDGETWSREYGAALLRTTTLHTFDYDLMDPSRLREAAQRNHSLIVLCEESDFDALLLFNRVSDPLSASPLARSEVWLRWIRPDFALELEPCGAGSELRSFHRSNGVCTALLHSAADRLNHALCI
jgi:hypothetical protein